MVDYSSQDITKISWQVIRRVGTNDVIRNTERLKVPGGWLVNDWRWYLDKNENESTSSSMIFYPDQDHTWTVDE